MINLRKKRVLILGASFSYIDSIKAAHRMGCEVLVADRNPNAPGLRHADVPLLVDIIDIDACIEASKKYNIDAVVAVNDFGVMTAARISESLGLPGLPVEVARIATDKYLMRKTWKEKNVPSVNYARVRNFEEFLEAVESLSFPLIVKPCDSRGGGCRGIRHFDESDDLQEVYDFSTGFYEDKSLLVEEFVTGLEHSVEAIVHEGRCHIIAISDKVKSPLPYRVDDTILYPTIEDSERLPLIEDVVERAVTSIGIKKGIAHVELSMTHRGPVLFEIGARCGGGAPAPLVPYLSGVEEFQEAVRIALGEKPLNMSPLHTRGCVIRFFYPRPGIVTNISGIEKIEGLPGILSFGIFVNQGDRVNPLRTCGDRAGMVITGGEDRQTALELADLVIDTVKIDTVDNVGVAA